MGPKKAPTTSSKAPAKTTGAKVAQSKNAPTKGGAKAPVKTPEEVKPKVTEKQYHDVPFKEMAKFLLDDVDGIIKTSERWPYCVDTRDITGRFLMMRHVNVINGLDANAMTPERVRQALLGAIRFGKPFAFDMMGSDLYETLDKIFEEIHPGLMKMVLDKSINKDDNFMKLVREDDSEEYQQSFQYDIHKERFEFIVLNNKEGPTGFSDKMMTVNIVHD